MSEICRCTITLILRELHHRICTTVLLHFNKPELNIRVEFKFPCGSLIALATTGNDEQSRVESKKRFTFDQAGASGE